MSCTPAPRSGKSISLPVLAPGDGPRAKVKPQSLMGKWRAVVLTIVHALILAHVAQWLISGMGNQPRRTLSPVEPSESMKTLEQGQLNAGFVMFLLAIAATLVLGRFFCGWACHVVALQDLCGWLMKKCGIHPKPWRSRLLVWVPLVLAVYMFVWPTVRRELVARWIGERIEIVDAEGARSTHFVLTPTQAAWLGEVTPLMGFENHFMVEDFWETFPPWYVAIPFLGICGFATVYFLGSKGFCTYGCPYGGFFGPAEQFAPLRIRVTDACEHCGHCTSVCTSNVRVHQEVRDFGMVVDPGCMKCMDCVSACPNDALYLGLGKPAVLAKPRDAAAEARLKSPGVRPSYDLTLVEEGACAVMLLMLFMGYRSMYGQIPLLMAIAIAGVGTFMLQRTWRLERDANVRGPFWQLKLKGRVTLAGWVFALATVMLTAIGVQGLVMNVSLAIGEAQYNQITTPSTTVLAKGYVPSAGDRERATRAIEAFRRASAISDGGVGFYTPWTTRVRLAWLYSVVADWASAEKALRAAVMQREPDAVMMSDLERIITLRGGTAADVARAREDVRVKWR